ncbi:MAG TPA: porin family protein [Gemmatimonadaceae bacterium]|nr:porin family protein [Gemmatimonadaceae bacterium]
MPARVLSFLLILPIAVALQAQSGVARIGVSGGVNLAHVEGSDLSDISNRRAGTYGAYVAYPLGADWSLQTGGLFSGKGWQRKEPDTGDLAVVQIDFVQVPLFARYDFGGASRLGVVAFGGPSANFRSGCSLVATAHATGATQRVTCADAKTLSNGTIEFQSFDWSAVGGLGLRASTGSARLLVTAQYERGFTHVEKSHDATSRATTFGVGLELPVSLRH